MKNKMVTQLYMFFGTTFVAAILIGNILASKQLQFFQWNIPAGTLIFPLTYIMSDVVAEIYGYKAMRRIIWIGFLFTTLQSLLMPLAAWLPAPAWFPNTAAFSAIANNAPRIVVGQIAAYLIGEWINAVVISKMKVNHFNKTGKTSSFKIRAVVSTLFGEFADSAVFIPIAFLGINPNNTIISTILLLTVVKTAYEVIMLPVTKRIVDKVKDYEGIDKVDQGENYNLIK